MMNCDSNSLLQTCLVQRFFRPFHSGILIDQYARNNTSIPAITVIQSNSVYYILCHVLSLFSGGVCGRRLTPRILHAMETGNKHRPCGPLARVRLCLTLYLKLVFRCCFELRWMTQIANCS